MSKKTFLYFLICTCAFFLPTLEEAYADYNVFDSRAMEEEMKFRSILLQQWANENEHAIRQTDALVKANDLKEKDMQMPEKEKWLAVQKLNDQTIAMLAASEAAYDEFGSASRYIASFQKSKAWELCLQSRNCDFNTTMKNLDNTTIDHATKAYENAVRVQQNLKDKIRLLSEITDESLRTNGTGATLDTMAKMNAQASNLLLDLNQQISSLVQIVSNNMANVANEKIANKAMQETYFKEVTIDKKPFDLNVSRAIN